MNNIDSVLYGHPLTFEQRKQLLDAEKQANHAHLQTDALEQWKQLPETSTPFLEISSLVEKAREIRVQEIMEATSKEIPTLNFISGAPGSGKSVLFHKLIHKYPDSVWICADAVKKTFKALLPDFPALKDDPNWMNDSFLHRLSSHISWGLLNEATLNRIDIIVETLGKDADSDFNLIKEVVEKHQYKASIHHVATSKQRAIEGAIKRYFGDGPEAGRHISLTRIADDQQLIFDTFLKMETRFKNEFPQVKCYAYDNRNWNRKIFYSREGEFIKGDLDFSAFVLDDPAPKNLWYHGENHTADLILLALDEQQRWNIALIVRDKAPFEGLHALPGGFVETSAKPGEEFVLGKETPEQAARREFEEETMGILDENIALIPVGIFRDRNRDPRNSENSWIASHAFLAIAPYKIALKPADDAREARWVLMDDVLNKKVHMAFDHYSISKKSFYMAHKLHLTHQPPSAYKHLFTPFG